MEKRKFSRVPFRTMAVVKAVDGTVVTEGEVNNLSLNGMLLNASRSIPANTRVHIEIFLDDAPTDVEIKLNGRVVRETSDGMAVQFDLTDVPLRSVTHLRYVVSYNLGDADMVMEEFFDSLTKS